MKAQKYELRLRARRNLKLSSSRSDASIIYIDKGILLKKLKVRLKFYYLIINKLKSNYLIG